MDELPPVSHFGCSSSGTTKQFAGAACGAVIGLDGGSNCGQAGGRIARRQDLMDAG